MNAREELLRYLIRYGGTCRDCADEDGVCPQTGIGCGDRRKATEFVLEALEYGTKHGFAAGYRILAPGQLDDETLERAASIDPKQFWDEDAAIQVLDAIRALKEDRRSLEGDGRG